MVTTRYDLSRSELAELLEGEPRYRVDQVWDGLHTQHREPAELTNVPKALRSAIEELLPPGLTPIKEVATDRNKTIKQLWQLVDGHLIESVLMHYRDRSTVCVSSQAGCAMACSFCATGQVGFDRHLTTGEIVEQVVRAAQRSGDRRVSNVVFMGMGEPLANFDNVWPAIERIHDDLGIGARKITVSTVGVVPGIERLSRQELPVSLAVSLHSANDRVRNRIAPINRTYPLRKLAEALHSYRRAKNRRLSFEWAMMAGVNDSETAARELAAFVRPLNAHVNLIPLNPTPGFSTPGTDLELIHWFRDLLESFGVNATIRSNRGTDIDAACGQLRAEQQVMLRGKPQRQKA
ncbi:MAG: 23S rRNA (adenine(2503)-C(2))-methyltransferase RlmN [Acidimicrobiaceae bacterium]|nr:23S rRNA (adenine(2503)-C(2))-methyltransferase RlmN [Acidimicrobiaceae bacterium]